MIALLSKVKSSYRFVMCLVSEKSYASGCEMLVGFKWGPWSFHVWGRASLSLRKIWKKHAVTHDSTCHTHYCAINLSVSLWLHNQMQPFLSLCHSHDGGTAQSGSSEAGAAGGTLHRGRSRQGLPANSRTHFSPSFCVCFSIVCPSQSELINNLLPNTHQPSCHPVGNLLATTLYSASYLSACVGLLSLSLLWSTGFGLHKAWLYN